MSAKYQGTLLFVVKAPAINGLFAVSGGLAQNLFLSGFSFMLISIFVVPGFIYPGFQADMWTRTGLPLSILLFVAWGSICILCAACIAESLFKWEIRMSKGQQTLRRTFCGRTIGAPRALNEVFLRVTIEETCLRKGTFLVVLEAGDSFWDSIVYRENTLREARNRQLALGKLTGLECLVRELDNYDDIAEEMVE
ncbi:MAG: hypothetical protein ACI8W8_003096 [Rhodothermales bacterium]|jgi:hypothetical protein